MIPNSDLNMDITFEKQPSKTYKLNLENRTIEGYCDEVDAIKQSINKILNTERYEYLIYSWNYGVELSELCGQDISYVYPELKRRIEEALIQDDRVISIDSFYFEQIKSKLNVSFVVNTIYGKVDIDKEVRY